MYKIKRDFDKHILIKPDLVNIVRKIDRSRLFVIFFMITICLYTNSPPPSPSLSLSLFLSIHFIIMYQYRDTIRRLWHATFNWT